MRDEFGPIHFEAGRVCFLERRVNARPKRYAVEEERPP
jgi:hypothetical protein